MKRKFKDNPRRFRCWNCGLIDKTVKRMNNMATLCFKCRQPSLPLGTSDVR